jgi:small subunit ribosomal protein S5
VFAFRAVVEAAGIRFILSKSLVSANPINLVRATMSALENLKDPRDVARRRGKELREIFAGAQP